EKPALLEGHEVVLSGIVRHHADHDVAVRIEVHQEGSEARIKERIEYRWSHEWYETRRTTIVAPFLLELADGQLVLIQPPKHVSVADALDQKRWIDRHQRVLSAELTPGERIWARGRLERS